MLNIPEYIKDLFRADNVTEKTKRQIRLRFYDEDVKLLFPEDVLFPSEDLFPIDQEPVCVIENDRILSESLMITESLCESRDLKFGECNAAQFEITVTDVMQDLTGKEFMATVEIGDYELALGIYRVESFVRQADRRRKVIMAFNRMRKFQTDVAEWYLGLYFPMTLRQFRDSLCTHIGIVQLDMDLPLDGMVLSKTIAPEQLNGLDVLRAICEINGCFGQIDRTGRLKYVVLSPAGLFPSEKLFPDEDIFPQELLGAEKLSYYKRSDTTYEDYVTTGIERLQIRQEEGDVGAIYGSGKNCYVIQGNFLVYGKSAEELLQISATVYDQVQGRFFRPGKIVGPALPWIEPGDGLICYTSDDVLETYCLKRTMSGIQSMMDTYKADGNIEQEKNFGIQTQIIQLEGKAAILKKSVEEVSVRVTDLKDYTEAQFKITAEAITAEVRRAQEAEAKLSVQAESISASVKNLKEFTEAEFIITAERISQKVSRGKVSAELSLEPDQVTISGNRLVVDSTNFKLDAAGNAKFKGEIWGSTIKTTTIEAGTIIGGTIDGSQITGAHIIAGDGMFEADDETVSIANFYTYDTEYGTYLATLDQRSGMGDNDLYNFWTGWDGAQNISSKEPRNVLAHYGCVLSPSNAYAQELFLNRSIFKGKDHYWGVAETIDHIYDQIYNLENKINNLEDHLQ